MLIGKRSITDSMDFDEQIWIKLFICESYYNFYDFQDLVDF